METSIRAIGIKEVPAVAELIGASVRGLQATDYSTTAREAALRTVFTVDTRLVTEGMYFGAYDGERMVGCGGWSGRKARYGGDHQVEHGVAGAEWMDPAVDAAKIRAIFVHPDWRGGGLAGCCCGGGGAAVKAGFRQFEMGSTLRGVALYTREGYREVGRITVPVGEGEMIEVVRMVKDAVKVIPSDWQEDSK